MRGIGGVTAQVQLAAIVGKDKEANCCTEGLNAARETTRGACQACQIVTQVSVDAFHRIGLALARDALMLSRINQGFIEGKGITEIVLCRRTPVEDGLGDGFTALIGHCPADNTTCGAIYQCQQIDALFLLPMKLNNSSCSSTCGS